VKLRIPGQKTPAAGRDAVAALKVQDRRRKYAERIRSADHAVAIPAPKNPRRRAAALKDPEKFLRTYFRHEFRHEFDGNMKEVIRIARMVLESGGRFACVLPRGAGKTTVLARLALWALLAGLRDFLVILAATDPAAARILQTIAVDLQANAMLAEDFPEICSVFRAGEQKPQRIRALHAEGEPLHADAKRDRLVFPSIDRPGSAARGQVVVCRGLTGALRGITHTRPDGVTVRPSCVLVDDPQTDGSAASQQQTTERENLIAGAVLGLAGPKSTVAVMVALTVIRPGDLADRLLDEKAHPEFQSRRFPLVEKWPAAVELWQEYTSVWQSQGPTAATGYYKKHKEAMDAGAIVPCSWRIRPGELSALQTATNLRLEMGEAAFDAEMQGQPPTVSAGLYTLRPEMIVAHAIDLPRLHLPAASVYFGGHVDVNRYALSWSLVAFDISMSAHVVAYGQHPGRGEAVWPENATPQIMAIGIQRNLAELCRQIAETKFFRDGRPAMLQTLLVDASYQSDAIHRFAEAARFPFRVFPAIGRASHKYSFRTSELASRPGERCHLQKTLKRHEPYVAGDVDHWKAIVQKSFLGNVGEPGCCTLHAVENPKAHLPYAEHICGERLVNLYETPDGPRYEFKPVSGARNDWLDSLVGAYIAAALAGGLSSTGAPAQPPRPPRRPKPPRISWQRVGRTPAAGFLA